MKKNICILSIALWLIPMISSAQDLPVPAEETGVTQAEASVSGEVPEEPQKAPEMLAAEELIAFFEGLEAAVQAANGDCLAMSDAMHKYYQSHSEWISNLDYASVNVDAQTIDIIHNKAIEFGKMLSVCYDQKSIPQQLRKYAGLGEEW